MCTKDIDNIQKAIESKFFFTWKFLEKPKRRISDLFFGKNRVHRFLNKYRYELVIEPPFYIVQLLGIVQKEKNNYFLVCCRDRGIQLVSCAQTLIPLKNKLKRYHYFYMFSLWNKNIVSVELLLSQAKRNGYEVL